MNRSNAGRLRLRTTHRAVLVGALAVALVQIGVALLIVANMNQPTGRTTTGLHTSEQPRPSAEPPTRPLGSGTARESVSASGSPDVDSTATAAASHPAHPSASPLHSHPVATAGPTHAHGTAAPTHAHATAAPTHAHATATPHQHVSPTPTPRPPVTPSPDPAPVAGDDYWNLAASFNEVQYIDLPVFDNDRDPGGPTFSDGAPFHTLSRTSGQHGTVHWPPIQCTSGTGYCLRYEALIYGPFRDSFTYTITDAGGRTDTATVTIDMPERAEVEP